VEFTGCYKESSLVVVSSLKLESLACEGVMAMMLSEVTTLVFCGVCGARLVARVSVCALRRSSSITVDGGVCTDF
jgi:hypothetical protein